MSNVLRKFVISSNVQKLYRFLPFKQNFELQFWHVLMINNKLKFQIGVSHNFYFSLCFDHFWENTLKIIELNIGGFNFVDISFSTFTD